MPNSSRGAAGRRLDDGGASAREAGTETELPVLESLSGSRLRVATS